MSVSNLRMVSRILEHADFVLYLDHDHSAMIPVGVSYMPKPCLECCIVRLENILRKGACNLKRLSIGRLSTWILLVILLEPQRSVTAH